MWLHPPSQTHPLTPAASCKGSIQLWDLGNLANKLSSSEEEEDHTHSPPRLGVVIAHEYGCVRALKWCHLGSHGNLLGVLSVACGDGCIRIMS